MSLPHLLLVDDSEAILAFEKAALASHYQISTATNGREALEKLIAIRPDGLILDLSMPEMDGEEVYAKLIDDPGLKDIPVIVVSSERQRGEAMVRQGAKAYLPKPIRADDLAGLVGRVLDEVQQRARKGNLAVLFVGAGPYDLALPLDCVSSVVLQPETLPLPTGPFYLTSLLEVEGRPVCVLDLPRRLGVDHAEPLDQRKLVVVKTARGEIALCVDRVRDPEEIPAKDVVHQERLAGANVGPLEQTLLAVVKASQGSIPVINPDAFASAAALQELPALASMSEKQRAHG